MGEKRSHSEANASENNNNNAHGGNKAHAHAKKPWKRQKVDVSAENLATIKKRARTLERLFAKDTSKIPADKQLELERELAAHKKRIAEAAAKKHRSDMIGKYHMVRFFERKKAIRLAKQLKRKLDETEDPEEAAKIKADLHIAEVDIDYAIYYPFLESYISLYPRADKEEEDDDGKPKAVRHLHSARPAMWTTIEKLREEGQAALERLQNRQPEASQEDKPAVHNAKKRAHVKADGSKTKHSGQARDDKPPKREEAAAAQNGKTGTPGVMNRRERRLAERNRAAKAKEDGSDSDGGGFFE
ncbi:hypothetical protein QBC39DRAFT_365357 [Podospora conica]|nr:hypothetical protein QBC39DRAFT_365357 [Schizothecium conicum]